MTTPPTQHEPDGLLDVEEDVEARVELPPDAVGVPPEPGTFRTIGMGMATLVALILTTYLVPGGEFARPWRTGDPVLFWNLIGRELLGESKAVAETEEKLAAMDALTQTATATEDDDAADPVPDRVAVDVPAAGGLPPYEAHPDDAEAVPQALELPSPDALDSFFAQLAETDAGYDGAVTRVAHWGDSVIAGDFVTSALRTRMQRRFGDAGHGWHLISTPTLNYRHRGVRFKKGDWANCYIINGCRDDGHYGLGGTLFTSKGASSVTFGTARKGAFGRKVSRFELWYAAEPRGGPIRVSIDGGEPVTLDGRADALTDAYEVFEVPDGEHEITVRANAGRGRLYGVVLEREGPGVVWDGMSNLGAFTRRMLRADAAHMAEQIERRDPSLLVFEFGGNDLVLKESRYDTFGRQSGELIDLYGGGTGKRACLVISPVDHGQRKSRRVTSVEAMRPISDRQRDAALAHGCAFFDAQAAMGGENAIALWRERKLMSADLKHLSEEGQQVFGHLVYLALMQAYRHYRERTAAG